MKRLKRLIEYFRNTEEETEEPSTIATRPAEPETAIINNMTEFQSRKARKIIRENDLSMADFEQYLLHERLQNLCLMKDIGGALAMERQVDLLKAWLWRAVIYSELLERPLFRIRACHKSLSNYDSPGSYSDEYHVFWRQGPPEFYVSRIDESLRNASHSKQNKQSIIDPRERYTT